jgi:hypothetical protein
MGVDEIVIEDLDFYSYEGEDGLEYIPIICELVQIFIHLSSFFSLICFIPFILTYMLSYGMLDLLSLIFVTGVFFFFELRDKLYELEKIVC